MAIMQSCCCWRSVRRGSFACAIYSGIYFGLLALTTGNLLQGESQYLKGNRSLPESTSFLESDTISPMTVRFNVTLLVCSCCGLICTVLLLYGLVKDQRVFLMPWIVTVITTCSVDVAHSLYLFIVAVPAVRYATQPTTTTATSCLSSRRAATTTETRASATPTQSPTAGPNTLFLEKSPARAPRKHVQFPDSVPECQKRKCESQITVLVPKRETEYEMPSSSRHDEHAASDQTLQFQKNLRIPHT